MVNYYDQQLAAERLRRCYEIAPARIKQYFQAELSFSLGHTRPTDRVLDLGCGFGRTLAPIARIVERVIGIDRSLASLRMARAELQEYRNVDLAGMDVAQLALVDNSFDLVFCIQNGLSAFHLDPQLVVEESIRVTKPGGRILFSTYSENIWKERLHWFELQAEAGLLGRIDYDKTGEGEIVCHDGFTATTITEDQFLKLTEDIEAEVFITEVDNSSLFCIIEL